MLVTIQSSQSLGREPKSGSLVVIRRSKQCLLLSLYSVNNSADKDSLWGAFALVKLFFFVGLSVMSGLASNPANREIASSSGRLSTKTFFFYFFQFFLAAFF
jgi:hypothetical protein